MHQRPQQRGVACEMWGKVGAESRPRGRPELVPADPLSARGISGIGFSQGHLGQAEGWLVPSLSSLLALSPGHFQRGWCVPCPCRPPSPCSPCVCQGICFCAILNNSIFIGPTKTYHPLPPHTLPVCAPLTSATGQLALSAFPMPLPPASLCFPPPPPKKSLAHAPVMPSLPGERGTVLGVPAGDTLGTTLGWAGGGGASWAPRGIKPKEKLGRAQLWLGRPQVWGGIFVLYFGRVPFPEPGLPVYCLETPIKNKPLAVVFSGLCLCVWSRVRGRLSSCITSGAPPLRSCCRQLFHAHGVGLALAPCGCAETGHSSVQE